MIVRPVQSPYGLRDRESGQAMIITAILLATVVIFLGVVLDWGRAAMQRRALQNAVDAAAQAAAARIYLGSTLATATSTADQVVQMHGYDSSDVTELHYLDSSGNATTIPWNVRTVSGVMKYTMPTIVMSIFGINTVAVAANASVQLATGSGPCVLCVLDPSAADALNENGMGNSTVSGGAVIVDSNNSTAATVLTGNATVTAPYIGIVGGYHTSGNAGFNNGGPNIPPATGIAPVPDPLASIPDPLSQGLCGVNYGSVNVTSSTTLTPGTYGSISVSGSANLTLQSGIYCITGAFKTSGSGTITGNGVMLYFTCGSSASPTACSPGQAGGSFALAGNGAYSISGPTSGTYAGLSVFYDRNNTASLTLVGNGNDSYTGTIYAKASALTLNGNGGTFQLNAMIVADTVTLTGNGSINIAYTQQANIAVPQKPVFSQ